MQVSDAAGHDMPALEDEFGVLRSLANMCQMYTAAIEQSVTGQLQRMGRSVPSKCAVCHKALHADHDKAMDPMNLLTAVLVHECGHIFHIMCLLTWRGKSGEQCPTCALRGKQEKRLCCYVCAGKPST